MRVTLIYNGDNVRVHREGCRDAVKEARTATTTYSMLAVTRQEVANDFYSDFFPVEMTEAEALGYCDFLPCTGELS